MKDLFILFIFLEMIPHDSSYSSWDPKKVRAQSHQRTHKKQMSLGKVPELSQMDTSYHGHGGLPCADSALMLLPGAHQFWPFQDEE